MIILPTQRAIIKSQAILPNYYADDFSGARDPAKFILGAYVNYNSLVTAVRTGGQLVLTPRTNAAGSNFGGYISPTTFNFTGKFVQIELVTPPNPAQAAYPEFGVWFTDKFAFILLYMGVLYFRYSTGGSHTDISLTYNNATHRFWRVEHDVGTDTMIWKTSADGLNWTVRRTIARAWVITACKMNITINTIASQSNPGTAAFDNFASNIEL